MDDAPSDRRHTILVARSPERAEHWVQALDDADIDALVELADAQFAEPGGSPLTGVLGGRPMEFVHVLTVAPADRDRAIAALIDAGWDGREGSTVRPVPATGDILRPLMIIAAVLAFLVFLRFVA